MIRYVILDSNTLIGALDTDHENPAHLEACDRFRALLTDDEVAVAITPLIRYEVLRGARRVSALELSRRLDNFQEFDVDGKVAEMAAAIYRYAIANEIRYESGQTVKIELKAKQFDLLHFSTAQLNNLDIDSADGDLKQIDAIYKVMTTPYAQT